MNSLILILAWVWVVSLVHGSCWGFFRHLGHEKLVQSTLAFYLRGSTWFVWSLFGCKKLFACLHIWFARCFGSLGLDTNICLSSLSLQLPHPILSIAATCWTTCVCIKYCWTTLGLITSDDPELWDPLVFAARGLFSLNPMPWMEDIDLQLFTSLRWWPQGCPKLLQPNVCRPY